MRTDTVQMITHQDRNKVSGSSICVLLDAPVVRIRSADAIRDPVQQRQDRLLFFVSVYVCLDRVAGASHEASHELVLRFCLMCSRFQGHKQERFRALLQS